ncbi:hypothetical protein ACFX11_010041 [Malus domestica]
MRVAEMGVVEVAVWCGGGCGGMWVWVWSVCFRKENCRDEGRINMERHGELQGWERNEKLQRWEYRDKKE